MGSDHHLIIFKITAGIARKWTCKVRDWKSVDWVHLQQDLHSSLQLCPNLFRNIDSPETLNVYERALTTNIHRSWIGMSTTSKSVNFPNHGGQLRSVSCASARTDLEDDGPVRAMRKTALLFCREDADFAMQLSRPRKRHGKTSTQRQVGTTTGASIGGWFALRARSKWRT